jgi:hypothetical protein
LRSHVTIIAVCSLLACALGAQAGSYTFRPYDADLGELPHDNYFTWGINWTKPATEAINSATLTYKHIWDWTEETDHLYTHLLDTVTDPNGPGTQPNWRAMTGYQTITITSIDNQGGGDNFSGQGYAFDPWSDPKGGHDGQYAADLSYYIPLDKLPWLADGNFGFGIDPDCHYYNCGVECVVTTVPKPSIPVPEANTVLLAMLGTGSLAGLRRLRGR